MVDSDAGIIDRLIIPENLGHKFLGEELFVDVFEDEVKHARFVNFLKLFKSDLPVKMVELKFSFLKICLKVPF